MDLKILNEYLKKMGFSVRLLNDHIKEYNIEINDYIIKINIESKNNILENSHINYGNLIKVEHGGITNFMKRESLVQLECVIRLLKKGYSPEEIELEKTYRLGHRDKGRLDVLLKKGNVPWALIECKNYGRDYDDEIKKLNTNGSQIFSYYAQDRTPLIIGVYCCNFDNAVEPFFYQISTNRLDKIGSVKDIFNSWDKNHIELGIFSDNNGIYELLEFNLRKKDLRNLDKTVVVKLYNSFMEILRKNAISDKSNAFNIFFNLFICKIYDEEFKGDEAVLDFQWWIGDNINEFIDRLSTLYYSSIEKYLSLNCNNEFYTRIGNDRIFPVREFAFIEILNKNDFIKNTNILIEVVKILQQYKIKYITQQQFLGMFFENLLNKGFKQESGQFFTPLPLTRFILKALPINKIINDKINNNEVNILPYIIDYACGSGHFLTEAMFEIEKQFEWINNDSRLNSPQKRNFNSIKSDYYWAREYIYGIEKDSRLAKTAKIAMFLNGDGDADIINGDGLADFYNTPIYKNKLKSSAEGRSLNNFDIIVSNPPFSIEGFFNTIDNINNFTLGKYIKEKSQEIECFFIERSLQLLKDNSYIGIILPLSIFNNNNPIYTFTRKLILMNFSIYCLAELREKAFSATTTSVVIMFMKKRSVNELNKMLDEFVLKKHYSNDGEIITAKNFINENKYIDTDIKGKFCDFIKENYLINNSLIVAYSGEKKTQEYFQGYRFNKARGKEDLVETNYGILNNLAFVIHNYFLSKNIVQISDELSKFCTFIKFDDLFINDSKNYLMNVPSKFLTKRTVKIESLSPHGDFIDDFILDETTLKELEENSQIEIINGLSFNKNDQVPFKTNTKVLTASNIDIKTGELLYEDKMIYLNEKFPIYEKMQIKRNDIIMSMSSGSLKHLGKVALIKEDSTDMIGVFLNIIRANSEELAYALFYRFMSKKFREYVFSKKGQNINNLNIADLYKLSIGIPKNLKAFLDKARSLN